LALAFSLLRARARSVIRLPDLSSRARLQLFAIVAVGAVLVAFGVWTTRLVGRPVVPLPVLAAVLTLLATRMFLSGVRVQRTLEQTSDLHLATIEALASAIDAKDQTSSAHIQRVPLYASALAEAAGMPPADVQSVRTAALLHDIGKLAVPEQILSKPGPLTPEEFQKVRTHAQIGAEIVAGVPFPSPVAPLILGHHERWDGKGYPHGLAGEEIPLGARVLAIADYYDSVTSERPYHAALAPESAMNLLRHESGRALDHTLVQLFLSLLPLLVEKAAAVDQHATKGVDTADRQPVRPRPSGGRERRAAFENIGLAHREIFALYEIAQAMGTGAGVAETMGLVSAKLAKVVPWSGCALFLLQNDAGLMRCRYADGVDAPLLIDSTLRLGQGLSGWVAEQRRPLVNGDPRAEFEAAGIGHEPHLGSALVCPLHFGDAVIGALALYHADQNRYTGDHRRLLASVAEQAGPVLHNAMLFEQAQEDSLTDPLTSLPNRRSLFARLAHELARAERLGAEVALIVLDVDEFKRINDRYGHHVGDRALRVAAETLRSGLRPYDLCVRFAGDEFIAVLSDCTPEAAEQKRRELQDLVGAIALDVDAGDPLQLSASAGAAVFPRDGASYEALLAEADRRMYEDKGQRRALRPAS
jgi:diguanylate cyclase (GGDEF)-like protein/putative nucleotidyltransferase with HDIG domain